jgi:GDP-L-fucose synthase
MLPVINMGAVEGPTNLDLAKRVCRALEFAGEQVFDTSWPNGTLRKLLNASREYILGSKATTGLQEGIRPIRESFRQQVPAMVQ